MLPYLAPPAAETVDSYSFDPKLPAGVKPVGPVEIDWTHSLAEGLSHFILFQNGEVVDIVTGTVLTKAGGTKWTPEGQYFDESGDYLTLANVELNSDFTVLTHPKFEDNSGTAYQFLMSFGTIATSNSFNWYLGEVSASAGANDLRAVGNAGAPNLNEVASYWSSKNNKPLAISISGTTANQYVEGVEVDDGGVFGTSAMSDGTTNTLYIGTRSDLSATRMFGGWMKYVAVYGDKALSANAVASLQRDPFQILKSPVTIPRITTPKPTTPTYEYTIPDPRWEAPAIMSGVKPTGPVVIDWDSGLISDNSGVWLFDGGGQNYSNRGGLVDQYDVVVNTLGNQCGHFSTVSSMPSGTTDPFFKQAGDTVTCYIRFMCPLISGQQNVLLFGGFTSSGNSMEVSLAVGTDSLRVKVDGGSFESYVGADADRWYSLVVTVDGTAVNCYVDGAHTVVDGTATVWAAPSSTSFKLGAGQVDVESLVIDYGRVMTPSEAIALTRNPYQFLIPA